jgi:hypothetical protein
MVSLQVVIQVSGAPMLNAWKDRPYRRRVTSRLVGDDALRRAFCSGDRAFEESLRRSGIALLAEVSVDDLAILIDCSIAVGPSAIEAAVHLVYSRLPAGGERGQPARNCPLFTLPQGMQLKVSPFR